MRDFLKPPANLTPPIALLPHDPNRKLRHILPKPSADAARLQYVPMVDYNLPIVFVPHPSDAGNDVPRDPLQTTSRQNIQRSYNASQIQQSLVSTNTKSTTQLAPVESPYNPNSSSSTVDSVNDFSVCDSGFLSGTTTNCGGTPSEDKNAKAALSTPTLKLTRNKTSSRTPKDISKRRSQVSKDSKRVPNILRRKKKPAKSPEKHEAIIQSPLRNCVQSTLAAINSSNHAPYSPNKRVDDLVNTLSATQSSPLGHNRSFDFLQYGFGSPGISPLRSPLCFTTGLTPLRQSDCDSGIISTPINSYLGDVSLNWTPFKTGLTPISNYSSQSYSSSSVQRCRKSLGLEQID
jgi:hypothetical protein